MSSLKFTITGTGRCGTLYTSILLTHLGIRTGHENVFTPYGEINHHNYIGDSSWMAVPFLSYLKSRGIIVVHQIRDRNNTVDSLNRIGFFDPSVNHGMYRIFAKTHALNVINAEQWYDEWNKRITPYADFTWHIENLTADNIFEMLSRADLDFEEDRIHETIDKLPKNINHR